MRKLLQERQQNPNARKRPSGNGKALQNARRRPSANGEKLRARGICSLMSENRYTKEQFMYDDFFVYVRETVIRKRVCVR